MDITMLNYILGEGVPPQTPPQQVAAKLVN